MSTDAETERMVEAEAVVEAEVAVEAEDAYTGKVGIGSLRLRMGCQHGSPTDGQRVELVTFRLRYPH